MDNIWRHATLYENPDDTFLQRLALSGRAQGDYAWFDGDEGSYDRLRWRRFRFGFIAHFVHNLSVQIETDLDLNNSTSDMYQKLTDAYLLWKPNDAGTLKLLKHSAGFTLDGKTSSKRLLTPERNNLTNNLWFTAEYFTGLSFSSNFETHWSYRAGVFSSDPDDEIGITGAGYFALLSLENDFSEAAGLDKATLRLDYVYNDKDPKANTRDFAHVISLAGKWENNDWGLWTDLSYGDGYYSQEDVRGLVLMPFYNITEKWQLVARATWLEGDGENGVRINRYEDRIASGRGDEYLEGFIGVNLFLYGHKLKWQNGLQYTDMGDSARDGGRYNGWGFTSGLRVYW